VKRKTGMTVEKIMTGRMMSGEKMKAGKKKRSGD